MKLATVKSYMSGSKWSGISTFLKKAAITSKVEIIVDIEKGWFTETVFFEATGSGENLEKFKKIIHSSIKKYNQED